jgi:uncharacterized protein
MASQFPVEKFLIDGPVGTIEIAAHQPAPDLVRSIAVVSHPHPLFGGSMDNKVVTTLARALFDAGAATYRYNFRGVGQTAGSHDDGRGETADLLAVIAHAQQAQSSLSPSQSALPLWLAGFSFGGAVTLAASESVQVDEMVLVAPGFDRMAHWKDVRSGGRAPASTLLIHGERDETVALAQSMDWAREREIAVTVVPNAEHFFHMRLHILKRLVARHLGRALA